MASSLHSRILPPSAASRLSRLEVLADTLKQSSNYAHNQMSEISKQLGNNPDMEAERREQIEIEYRELAAQRDELNARHRDAAGLVGNLHLFLQRLSAEPRPIEQAPDTALPKKKGESLKALLERLRTEIIACKQQQHIARIAPAPVEDLREQARAYVKRLAAQVSPMPTPSMAKGEGFGLSFFGDDPVSSVVTPVKLLAAMCWADPARVTERLVEAVETMPKPAVPPLSADEKRERLKELAATLDRVEREEEAVIRACHEEGLTNVVRRADASPMAVLAIRYAIKPGLKPIPRRPTANGANGNGAHPPPLKQAQEQRVRLHPSKMETKDARRASRH